MAPKNLICLIVFSMSMKDVAYIYWLIKSCRKFTISKRFMTYFVKSKKYINYSLNAAIVYKKHDYVKPILIKGAKKLNDGLFSCAVANNNIFVISSLLEYGNGSNGIHMSDIYIAVKNNNIDIVKLLLSKNNNENKNFWHREQNRWFYNQIFGSIIDNSNIEMFAVFNSFMKLHGIS